MKIKEIKIVNQDQSTEIADIGADAINVDYNDTTVKAELDKLNNDNNTNKNNITNLQGGLSTINSNLTLQTSRIDNLAHLDEGSTTGDAELIDIRTGYNGINYSSAGEAVRNGDLKNSNLIEKIANTAFGFINVQHIDRLPGYLFNNRTNSMQAVNGGNVKKFLIDKDTLYYITTALTTADHYYPAIIYMNSDNQKIGTEYNQTSDELILSKSLLHIPDDATYFYLNARDTDSFVERYNVEGLRQDIDSINAIITGKEINLSWLYKSNVYIDNNQLIFVSVDTRSLIHLTTYVMTGLKIQITPKDGFLSSLIEIDPTGIPSLKQDFTEGIQFYYLKPGYDYYLRAKKKDDSAFEGNEDILDIAYPKIGYAEDIQNLENSLGEKKELVPDDIFTSKLYNIRTDTMNSIGNGTVIKINTNNRANFWVTTSLTAQDATFPLIIYFDANGNRIGIQYPNTSGVLEEISHQLLSIPIGTAYFYVNGRDVVPIVESIVCKIPENASIKKEISILFIGNSLTQDGIAYLPYLLKEYYKDEINFKIYMWYCGGYTLAEHYQRFTSDSSCDIFSVAENKSSWSNSHKTMSKILSTYKFDIVCMQEYFNYKENYEIEDLTDWNNCRDYIINNYTGGNALKFISLLHAPKRSDATNIFNRTVAGNNLILKETISEDIIPIGTAVYRALSTELDSLGSAGHLSPDGTHTQEGLPCLLQTYVALLWVLDKLNINKSIYNCDMRMTTDIYDSINVPGANLGSGVITGTDAQNILAQEIAIKAYKEGKKQVLTNLSNY